MESAPPPVFNAHFIGLSSLHRPSQHTEQMMLAAQQRFIHVAAKTSRASIMHELIIAQRVVRAWVCRSDQRVIERCGRFLIMQYFNFASKYSQFTIRFSFITCIDRHTALHIYRSTPGFISASGAAHTRHQPLSSHGQYLWQYS